MKKLINPLFYLAIGIMVSFGCKSEEETPGDGNNNSNAKEEDAYAFPGAEGFGQEVTGGRGGRVIKVTNLNDSGIGSFRNAVEGVGPRIVVFEVSGNIELERGITIRNKDLTIAGQTAPGDGITVKNYSVVIGTENVIIRYLRFRMGDTGAQEADAMEGRYQKDIIVDHCSLSWSTDECGSFYGNNNFTLQWSILTESLKNSVHEKGSHGYGGIWGGKNASFHHNLLAHHDNRNPRFDHPGVYGSIEEEEEMRGDVDFRNNVIYNWGGLATYGGERGTFNMVNNYYKPGPASRTTNIFLLAYKQATSSAPVYGYGKFYIEGNILEGRSAVADDNWLGVEAKGGSVQDEQGMKLDAPLGGGDLVTTHDAETAYDKVLALAGASLNRDAVDSRVVDDVKNGTYYGPGSNGSDLGIIDSQNDVGGWPELQSGDPRTDTDGDGMPDEWELENGLDPEAKDHDGRDLSTAYDNVEVYINSLVEEITEQQE